MNSNVFAMRSPTVGLTCKGGVYAYPSQLHPPIPPPDPSGGGGSTHWHRPELNMRGCRPEETWWECRKRKDEEAMIVLGLI